ncbi:MAG: hypothetical protein KGZ35_04155 [Truepera sp.]|nr:hypothetical protein [Truepera sp.]
MPIEASRRQLPSADALSDTVVFATHRRLARRHQWQQRLLFAGGGALLGSLIGLLLDSTLWQALSLMVGFAAGLLIPRAGSEAWAIDWIEAQVGFSYRTALELSHDTYGLAPAVKARARQALRRLTPPKLQPWWLPALVLALSLLLLPLLGLEGWRGNASVATPPGGNATPATIPPPEQDAAIIPTPDEPQAEPGATPPNEADTPTAAPDLTRDVDLTGPGRDSAGEGAARNAPLDSETLSEFLERLAQEPPREVAPVPVRPPRGESPSGQAQEALQPDAGAEEAEPQGEQRGNAVTGDERPAGAEANGEGQASPDNQPGDLAQEPGQEPGENAGTAGEPSPEAGGEEASQELGDTPNDGAGEAAGAGETVPVPVAPAPGAPGGPLEFLPGQLQEGPAARAGVILQPGVEPAELPAGMPAGGFERAVEQALTEGRIPVKFQEILRNYFR